LIGLGDIVLPGLVVAFCHRIEKQLDDKHIKIYLVAVLGYSVGLCTCGFFLVVFKIA
jgi:hypothetical protein